MGVLFGPLLGSSLELSTVALVELGDLGNERVVGIGVGQKRGNGEQNFRDGEGRGPLVLENVQAN